ncbi:DNA repair exonuclease [Verticiella sediminum]|uniref:DNA repair exonuclease n=1 Tax=Verticiella sediminum TaxID=1247510 RepID=A0A556AS88_9BURK|nr:DNA repair exonuclease [Verticiella sediminum]TSH95809.1 DNA repair exonuclease [Verticiella sediminum]
MPLFLHTADWQIGRHYGQLDPADGAILAEARFEAVATLARIARERQVDAVLVAGDVFDMQEVSDRTIRRLFGLLEAYAGPWVLLAGNHDAALPTSVWTRARALGCVPPQVRIPDAPGVLGLPEAGLAVLAAPLTQRQTYDDVTRDFDAMQAPAGLVRVGLAHGSVSGRLPEAADASNPIDPARAERASLDYLALGDWHGCLRIDARTWYAGTPEPDRFRGNEPGVALAVRIDRPGALPEVERIPVGRYRWQAWRERIALPGDVEALAARLAALGADDVLRLTLEGEVDGAGQAALERAIGQAQGRARALRASLDGLRLVPADADFAEMAAGGYLADVVAELRFRQDDPQEGAVAREALRVLLGYARESAAGGGA